MDRELPRVACLVFAVLTGPLAASQGSRDATHVQSIYVVAVRAPGDATLFRPSMNAPPSGRPLVTFPGPELLPQAARQHIGGMPDANLKTTIERRFQEHKRHVLASSVEAADLVFFAQGQAVAEFVADVPPVRPNTPSTLYIAAGLDEQPNVLTSVTAVAVSAGVYRQSGVSATSLLAAALWQGLAIGANGAPAPVDALVDRFNKDFRGLAVSGLARVVTRREEQQPPLPPSMLQTVVPPGSDESIRSTEMQQELQALRQHRDDTVARQKQENARGPADTLAGGLYAVPQPPLAGPFDASRVLPAAESLSVALIIDASTSMGPNYAALTGAASTFIDGLQADDQVMVVSFGSRAYLSCELTRDRSTLRRTLDQMRAVGSSSRLYDTLLATAERIGPVAGRKAIVLLTDGLDVGSQWVDSAGALAKAQAANIPVYVVHYDTTKQRSVVPPPGVKPRVVPDGMFDKPARFGRAAEYLRSLGQASGGRYELADSVDAVASGFSRVAQDLKRE